MYITGRKMGCGFMYLEVKSYREVRSGLNNQAVIVNWEILRSLEVRNVQCIKSMANSTIP